jgi:MIP family channel proteins
VGQNVLSKCIAEFIGVFTLIVIGAGSVCLLGVPHSPQTLVGIAIAHGLVIAVMICALGHISGAHFNPAVTVAMITVKKIEPPLAIAYIIAQLAGSLAGAYVLKEIFAPNIAAVTNLGTTAPGNGFTPMATFYLETILTFFLVLVIFGSAVDKRGANVICPLAIGGTVALDILFGGPLTGASMNPAKTLGPAVMSGTYTAHWAYWAGPILGGVIAANLYTHVIGKSE